MFFQAAESLRFDPRKPLAPETVQFFAGLAPAANALFAATKPSADSLSFHWKEDDQDVITWHTARPVEFVEARIWCDGNAIWGDVCRFGNFGEYGVSWYTWASSDKFHSLEAAKRWAEGKCREAFEAM